MQFADGAIQNWLQRLERRNTILKNHKYSRYQAVQIQLFISNPKGWEHVTFWFICCLANQIQITTKKLQWITTWNKSWDFKHWTVSDTRRSLCSERKRQLWPLENTHVAYEYTLFFHLCHQQGHGTGYEVEAQVISDFPGYPLRTSRKLQIGC